MDLTEHIVDGSRGEGGGQVVRSSLALAAITGQAVEIRAVRARRKTTGLKAQHVTAARATAEICGATLAGDTVGSSTLRIEPQAVRGGDYFFDVGTAGSTMLVLQTLLPPLLGAPGPSQVELVGGTHNPLAPSLEYLDRVYLPTLRKMGAEAEVRLIRRGFYPRGGGHVRISVSPAPLRPIRLLERGAAAGRRVTAICSRLPAEIGDREVDVVLRGLGWQPKDGEVIVDQDSDSPGNVLLVETQFAGAAELVSSHGRLGLPAERVAKRAVRDVKRYLDAGVPVGEHLADQLLLPMGIAAWQGAGQSSFRTLPLSEHATTQIMLLRQLLGIAVAVEEDEGASLVTVG